MQRSTTLVLNSRALGYLARCPPVRFNSSDAFLQLATSEARVTPRRAIPLADELGGISLSAGRDTSSTAPGPNSWQPDLSSLAVHNFGTAATGAGEDSLAARLARKRVVVKPAKPNGQAEPRATPPRKSSAPASRGLASAQYNPRPAPPCDDLNAPEKRSPIQQLGALYVSQESLELRISPGAQRVRQAQVQPGVQQEQTAPRQPRQPRNGQQPRDPKQRDQRQGTPMQGQEGRTARTQSNRSQNGQQQGRRAEVGRSDSTTAPSLVRPPARTTRPTAPRPLRRRRGDDAAPLDEIPPSKVDSLGHLPATVKLDGRSVEALYAPRGSALHRLSNRARTFGSLRRRRRKPLVIVKDKPLSSRTKAFRQRAAGDYSRYRPEQIKAGPHVNALKPTLFARVALSHNRTASLRGRAKALRVINQALSVAPGTGAKVAQI